MYNKKAHLHFMGIGGIGMSGIATILKYQGYIISGCDLDLDQHSIKNLQEIGCQIFQGNNSLECQRASIDVLVYSSAVKLDNPEIVAAQQRGIPTIARALMLAELMRTKFSVGIAGSHGKTTTTSLIGHILMEAQLDPTIIVGGHLKSISHNARLGAGDFLIAETDESDRSFLHLYCTLDIVTNIDLEHLETYKDLDDIKETFKTFLNHLPFYGKAIVCNDDENIRSLLPLPHVRCIKYGIDNPADIRGNNVQLHPDYSEFELYYKEQLLGSVNLAMPGKHNVLNALAAIALSLELEIPFATIAKALETFKGVDRRFTYKGVYKGAEIFDDYGHHPEEIKNTLLVARKRTRGKLIVAFQPHRYTRTQKLWHNFIEVLGTGSIDSLIITDIYPASENPIEGINSQKLVTELKQRYPELAVAYQPLTADFNLVKNQLDNTLKKDDLILFLGAGKINSIIKQLN